MAINKIELNNQIKANQFDGYKKAIEQEHLQKQTQQTFKFAGIKWNINKEKHEKTTVNPIMDSDYVSVSSIRRAEKEVTSTIVSHKLGYKITLEEKIEVLKDKYIKNFLQSRSHNFIVSKFAQLKTAFLGQLLSNLGVTIPDLQKMQKKALQGAIDENELLFEENEYNAEMISLLGGSGKKLKKELQIMDEIRTQLVTQMRNYGKEDYYTQEKVLEMKIKACKKIREEFVKEKEIIEYERNMHYLDRDSVKSGKKNVLDT